MVTSRAWWTRYCQRHSPTRRQLSDRGARDPGLMGRIRRMGPIRPMRRPRAEQGLLAFPRHQEVAGVGPGAELGRPVVLGRLRAAQHERVAVHLVDALADL